MTNTSNANIAFDGFDETICIHCGTVLNIAGREPFTPIQCTKCHNSFPVPAQLDDYILVEKLGQGGMGAVFRGFDPKLKRSIAVKVMNRQLGGNKEFTGQFLREAQTLAALNNPNVVQVHNFGEKRGQPYMVMELIDGGRLDRMIKEHGALKESFVVRTAIDVIKGLHAAANMGLAHGDVKPDNVLFDRDGNAKVVDFGLARFKGEIHRPGEIWGTPFYIAPEVIHGKQPNLQADIYSLGCTLFHALAGRPPFSKDTVQETVLARLKEPPPDLQTIRPEIHPETAAVIARMLEVDPFRRYPNYDSLMTDIQEAQKTLERGTGPGQQKTKKSAVPVAIVILAVAAIVGFVLHSMMTRQEKPTPPPAQRMMKLMGGKLVPVDEFSSAPAGTPFSTNAPAPMAKPADRAPAVVVADHAGNYVEWGNGATSGTGFGRWTLRCAGEAGFFIGTSLDNSGGVGGIDTRGKSWGLFAHSKGNADAYRSFAGGPLGLSPQHFAIDLDNGFVNAGASVGVGLQNVASNTLWELFFVGSATNYIIRDGAGETDTGMRFTTSGLHCEFRLIGTSVYSVRIVAGGRTNTLSGSLIKDPDQSISMLHLWNFNAGPGKDHDVYFNNVRIAE